MPKILDGQINPHKPLAKADTLAGKPKFRRSSDASFVSSKTLLRKKEERRKHIQKSNFELDCAEDEKELTENTAMFEEEFPSHKVEKASVHHNLSLPNIKLNDFSLATGYGFGKFKTGEGHKTMVKRRVTLQGADEVQEEAKINRQELIIIRWFDKWSLPKRNILLFGLLEKCPHEYLQFLSTTIEPIFHRDFSVDEDSDEGNDSDSSEQENTKDTPGLISADKSGRESLTQDNKKASEEIHGIEPAKQTHLGLDIPNAVSDRPGSGKLSPSRPLSAKGSSRPTSRVASPRRPGEQRVISDEQNGMDPETARKEFISKASVRLANTKKQPSTNQKGTSMYYEKKAEEQVIDPNVEKYMIGSSPEPSFSIPVIRDRYKFVNTPDLVDDGTKKPMIVTKASNVSTATKAKKELELKMKKIKENLYEKNKEEEVACLSKDLYNTGNKTGSSAGRKHKKKFEEYIDRTDRFFKGGKGTCEFSGLCVANPWDPDPSHVLYPDTVINETMSNIDWSRVKTPDEAMRVVHFARGNKRLKDKSHQHNRNMIYKLHSLKLEKAREEIKSQQDNYRSVIRPGGFQKMSGENMRSLKRYGVEYKKKMGIFNMQVWLKNHNETYYGKVYNIEDHQQKKVVNYNENNRGNDFGEYFEDEEESIQMFKAELRYAWKCISNWPKLRRVGIINQLLKRCPTEELSYFGQRLVLKMNRNFIAELPAQLSLRILSYLDAGDLCRCCRVDKFWSWMSNDNALWRKKCEEKGWVPSIREMRTREFAWQKARRASITQLGLQGEDEMDEYDKGYKLDEFQDIGGGKSFMHINSMGGHFAGANVDPGSDDIDFNWKVVYAERYWLERSGSYQVKTLKGHSGAVTCVRFSGQRIVTGSVDRTIKVWDMKSGACLRTLEGHSGGVWCLQFDSEKIVTGSWDSTIKVWNTFTGECKATLSGHSDTVSCLAYNAKIIVTGSHDNELKIWDSNNYSHIRTIRGCKGCIYSLDLHEDLVCTGSGDHFVRCFDTRTGQLLRVFEGHRHAVMAVKFDQTVMVSAAWNTIRVWNFKGVKCVRVITAHTGRIEALCFRGSRVISSSRDKTIKEWNIHTGACVRTLTGHHKAVNCISMSGSAIMSGSNDSYLKVWTFNGGPNIDMSNFEIDKESEFSSDSDEDESEVTSSYIDNESRPCKKGSRSSKATSGTQSLANVNAIEDMMIPEETEAEGERNIASEASNDLSSTGEF
eukprot:Nk52_evm7s372 gene=Nk52_evmTU7s372